MNNIKTIEDACKALGLSMEEQFPANLSEVMSDDEIAYRELKIIAKALNQSDGNPWTPDWDNSDEYKYYPWFDMETYNDQPSGSGFSYDGCNYVITATSVGSRLVFKSSELAKYAGEQFLATYKRFFVIQK